MADRFSRRWILGTGLVLAVGVVLLSLAGRASGGATDCGVVAGPPTLYAGMVFADGRVECTSVNRIRITVALENDGVEVARQTRNDCRKTIICHNSTTHVLDEPGNQVWCSRAWGWAQGIYLGEVVACEENLEF
jgi:hypothetical protein